MGEGGGRFALTGWAFNFSGRGVVGEGKRRRRRRRGKGRRRRRRRTERRRLAAGVEAPERIFFLFKFPQARTEYSQLCNGFIWFLFEQRGEGEQLNEGLGRGKRIDLKMVPVWLSSDIWILQ